MLWVVWRKPTEGPGGAAEELSNPLSWAPKGEQKEMPEGRWVLPRAVEPAGKQLLYCVGSSPPG